MRQQVTVSGKREDRFFEIKELMGFETDAETMQYLVNRGIEGLSQHLFVTKTIASTLRKSLDMQTELFDLMEKEIPKT